MRAMQGVDKVFLMRLPAISDVKHIAFLSLQGVRFNPLTPHFKVEKYLRRKKAPYTFLRPNFFMQNLSTVYKDDIKDRNEIFLPAGKGKTAFVDVRDIGAVVAEVRSNEQHIGKAYTLSGSEALDYFQVSKILSDALKRDITYQNPTVAAYVERKKSDGIKDDYMKLQKMLYFVVRHNFSSDTADDIATLLGLPPTSFQKFATNYSSTWQQ